MKKNTIGIVGGNGFIGRNLVNYFVNLNYDVYNVSRNINKSKFQHPNIFCIEVNAEDTVLLYDSLKECDTIIWLISNLIPGSINQSLIDDFDININILIRYLEKAKYSKHLKRFIFLSSGGTIYGDILNNEPIGEDGATKPISSYGLSKLVTEKYIEFLTLSSQFQSFILRPSNVYGKFQNFVKPQGIIGYAFKAIINDTPINLYNGGLVTRDFIHVKDLSDAIYCCMKTTIKPSKTSIYNVGTQCGITINEILEKISIITKKQIIILPKSSRIFDCNYNVLQINKIKRDLNWEPKIKLEDGLNLVWNWIKYEEDKK